MNPVAEELLARHRLSGLAMVERVPEDREDDGDGERARERSAGGRPA